MMGIGLILFAVFLLFSSLNAKAASYDGEDLAFAILANDSTLVSSYFEDRDNDGCRQAIVLSSFGDIIPTDGSNFALFSTGIAGGNPVTTDAENPGDERGTWLETSMVILEMKQY